VDVELGADSAAHTVTADDGHSFDTGSICDEEPPLGVGGLAVPEARGGVSHCRKTISRPTDDMYAASP
jgi:hypothetical protein